MLKYFPALHVYDTVINYLLALISTFYVTYRQTDLSIIYIQNKKYYRKRIVNSNLYYSRLFYDELLQFTLALVYYSYYIVIFLLLMGDIFCLGLSMVQYFPALHVYDTVIFYLLALISIFCITYRQPD